jgi:hypothetical protein
MMHPNTATQNTAEFLTIPQPAMPALSSLILPTSFAIYLVVLQS